MLDAIYSFDLAVYDVLEPLHSPFLNSLFIFITKLGDHGILWIAMTLLLLCFKRTRTCGVTMACAFVVFLVLNNFVLKPLVNRPRPYETYGIVTLVPWPHDSSFPSGHAAMCMACAFAFAWTIGRAWPLGAGFEKKTARLLTILVYAVAVAISFSRIWVKVHYCTDVLGGMLSGTLCSLIGVWLAGLLIRLGEKIGIPGLAKPAKQ